jgi:hypothetical protein
MTDIRLIIALLGFPVVFLVGWPTHLPVWRAIRRRRANMDVLISLGSVPPYFMGIAALIWPGPGFIEMAMGIVCLPPAGQIPGNESQRSGLSGNQETTAVGGEDRPHYWWMVRRRDTDRRGEGRETSWSSGRARRFQPME